MLSFFLDDEDFYEYIYRSNCELGKQQCLNLKKIQVFAKNPNLRETRQMDTRKECLKIWKVGEGRGGLCTLHYM